jgi:molybdate transport system ATP-binding protein
MSLKLRISKSLKSNKLVVNHSFDKGQIVGVFGDSGIGKSSLFNIIAGFDKPNSGEVIFNNEIWYSSSEQINIPVSKRKVGYSLQDSPLFENLTPKENLLLTEEVDGKFLDDLIVKLNLQEVLKYKNSKLSGGQSQLINVARALLANSKLILLDEPFNGLSEDLSFALCELLRDYCSKSKALIFVVSHDFNRLKRICKSFVNIKQDEIEVNKFSQYNVDSEFVITEDMIDAKTNTLKVELPYYKNLLGKKVIIKP